MPKVRTIALDLHQIFDNVGRGQAVEIRYHRSLGSRRAIRQSLHNYANRIAHFRIATKRIPGGLVIAQIPGQPPALQPYIREQDRRYQKESDSKVSALMAAAMRLYRLRGDIHP